MAENTDEEHLDRTSIPLSENLADQNIPNIDAETNNSNPKIENMEVHKHPYHVTHKKKWGEYLLEFLMLFLAVFLGFVAENIREHLVEHDRSKEYAISLVQDLANDTTELLDVIREDKLVLICFDSIGAITYRITSNHSVPGSLYFYSTLGTISPIVKWNNSTLTQITQSGNLRYFKNPEVLKQISFYYTNADYIKALNDNDKFYRQKSMELRNKILNNFTFKQYTQYNLSNWFNVPDSILKKQLSLQSYDLDVLNEFANSFETRRTPLGFVLNNAYPLALKTAKELIELLKSEYNLK